MPKIRELSFFPFDVPLLEPFGIATGAQIVARNVLVRVVLDDGTRGLGEAAPFPAVNGETQEDVLARLPAAAEALRGLTAERYRVVGHAAHEVLHDCPSALAAVETALLDALCRRWRVSLCSFFGGAETELSTDVTIPTGDVDQAAAAAARAVRDGFRVLKVKVGGSDLDLDEERLSAIVQAAPRALLVLDANASLKAEEALALLAALGHARDHVILFEQPTRADDLDGMRKVRERGQVAVAADESARSTSDVARLAQTRAADVINIKIMKAGVFQAWEMVLTARALGLELMVGGMVETELAMTTSACLAAGIGKFRFIDLDTPLFMGPRPLRGGFEQRGPHLRLAETLWGHGVQHLGVPSKSLLPSSHPR